MERFRDKEKHMVLVILEAAYNKDAAANLMDIENIHPKEAYITHLSVRRWREFPMKLGYTSLLTRVNLSLWWII